MTHIPAIPAILAGLALASCASDPIKVVSQTPASIEFSCEAVIGGCPSPQAVADRAQAHCRAYGRNAAQDQLTTNRAGDRWVTYRCISD